MKKNLIQMILMLFCSIAGYGYEWKGMKVKLWSEMTDQEILDEYEPYIQNRTFYCEMTKDGVNYTTSGIEGFTYQYCYTALDGMVTNYTLDKFLGYFRLCDKDGITGIGSTWNDTTIYDETGIKHAREVVFKNWKKQFEKVEGKARVVWSEDSYSGRITIPEKISVTKADKIVLKYVEDDYYNDFWTGSVSLPLFASYGGGDAYVVGSFEVTDVINFNASQEGLISVSFPTTVTKGFPSLANCVNLEKVEFSSKATSMPILKGCKSLKFLNQFSIEGYFKLPSTLERLGSFTGCEKLKQIVIPDNVKELEYTEYYGDGLFQDCTSLTSIVLGKGIPYISNSMFKGCTSLSSITIPSQITSINDFAFEDCTNLAEVLFENDSHLETIGSCVFESCGKIKQLSFPEPLKSIGGGAFYGCTALEVLVLPSTIESLGRGNVSGSILGSGCINLLDIYVQMPVPFEISHYIFEDYSEGYPREHIYYDTYLHVPSGTVADYRKTNCWNKFAHITSFKSPLHSVPAYGTKKRVTVGDFNYIINTSTKKAMLVAGNYSEKQSVTIPSTITWDGEIYDVTEISGYAFHNCEKLLSATLGENLENIGESAFEGSSVTGQTVQGPLSFPEGLKTIGNRAYYKCTRVHVVELPSTLQSIGEDAFYPGYNIQKVVSKMTNPIEVPDNAFPFDLITDEETPLLYVPAGTKSLYEAMDCWNKFKIVDEAAPDEPSGLNDDDDDDPNGIITFADAKVKTICIANWDTNGDQELSKAEAAAVTDIGNMFKNNKELMSFDELRYFTGLTTIPQSAFSGCKSLASIKLPSNITTIQSYAFSLCNELTSITIPATVTSIGAYEFQSCHKLSEIIVEEGNTVYDSRNNCNAIIETSTDNLVYGCKNTVIPESVTQSGPYVFYGNEGLTTIHIPASMTNINNGLFGKCKNLTVITVADNNNVYDSRNNCNAIIRTASNDLVQGCRNTVIPNSVVSIHNQAFADGRAVGKVTIPGNVKTVGDQAFTSCPELKTIIIEEGVETVGYSAFQSCNTLETIVLPSTLTSIDSRAFANDGKVKYIISAITTPFEIPSNAFSSCYTSATLYVPTGTKALYEQTPGWQDFTNIVEMNAVKPGDANSDGYVTPTDVNVVKDKIMTGMTEGLNFINADTNGDYEINAADIVNILNLIK